MIKRCEAKPGKQGSQSAPAQPLFILICGRGGFQLITLLNQFFYSLWWYFLRFQFKCAYADG